MPFDSNQGDHRVVSTYLSTQGNGNSLSRSPFTLKNLKLSFFQQFNPLNFLLVSKGLGVEHACFFMYIFSDQIFPYHPTNNQEPLEPLHES